jgi:hypothetical protein
MLGSVFKIAMISNHGSATASISVPSFVRAPGTITVCKCRLGMGAGLSSPGDPNIAVFVVILMADNLWWLAKLLIIIPEPSFTIGKNGGGGASLG